MKKEELKVGMVVEVKESDGTVSLCMILPNDRDKICVSGDTFWCNLTEFNDDLIAPFGSKITKVFSRSYNNRVAYKLGTDARTLIWERKEAKELTVAEIEELLGYPIKVVK